MPQYSNPDRLPSPVGSLDPPTAQNIQDLAAALQTTINGMRDEYKRLSADSNARVEDARLLNGITAETTSDTDVGTAALDFGGASISLSANVGATVTTTFAVECATWNALSVFTGSLRVIRLSDRTAIETLPRPVVWAPGIAVPRNTLTTTYTIPPNKYSFNYGLQLSGIKTNNNAAYRVLAGLTKLTAVTHRTGTR